MTTLYSCTLYEYHLRNMTSFALAKPAFSQRFMKLQEDLKATLQQASGQADDVLTAQDQLITRLEGWIDSIEDLNMLARRDIDLFRQALSANRRVYRMKVLAMHNIEVAPAERDALLKSLSVTIRKIFSAAVPPEKMNKDCAAPDEAYQQVRHRRSYRTGEKHACLQNSKSETAAI